MVYLYVTITLTIYVQNLILLSPRRYYSTGNMTTMYLVRWNDHLVNEFSSFDISLWNQYQYIAFNISSWRILITSNKVLIITGISNEKINELIKYAILCWKVTIFYRQKLASLFQVQEKLKACRNSKCKKLDLKFL